MKKKKNLFLCLCLFVDYLGKRKYKELELMKLEFSRNSSTIEEKKKEHYTRTPHIPVKQCYAGNLPRNLNSLNSSTKKMVDC